jgi:hypothetical protein
VGEGGGEIDPRTFVTDPEAFDVQVDITRVQVFDSSDPTNLILLEDSDLGGVQDPDITIDLSGLSAVIAGVDQDYTIEFTTAAAHDMALVENIAGKYDIGGFNLLETQPTPDQKYDFTVDITDFDGDAETSNEFSIGVDGTGPFDDDHVDGVLA